MNTQSQQRFCTNCGHQLAPGSAFCVNCGTPNQAPAGVLPGSAPPAVQMPTQTQDDPLLAGLAAGFVASRARRQPLQQTRRKLRRPRSRLGGCGCLLLLLVLLAGPFIGVALTSGMLHLIFTYVSVGMVLVFFLMLLIAMLVTRGGREVLAEGCAEGCLDAIFGGLLGGG
jgi:zinc-ribbon domain